jgi:putative flippase GtrA
MRYIILQDSRDLRESFFRFAIVGMCVLAVTFLFCWSLRLWTRKRLVSRSRKLLRRESAHALERSGMTHRTLLLRSLITWAPSALVSGAAFFYALIVYTQIIKP